MRNRGAFPRGTCGILAAILLGLLTLLGAREAAAQAAGADVRLGNLRDSFQNAFPGQATTLTGGWTWGASLGIDETYNSATPNNTRTGAKPDFYTSITPSLSVQGDAPRLSGSLFYSPQARLYVHSASQNAIFHSFNGSLHVTAVPDLAFIDLRGTTSLQSRGGGIGPNGTTSLSQQDEVQTSSLSADTYLVHRFNNFGSARLGYSISQTIISGAQSQVVSPFVTPQSNQSLRTMSPHFSFTTGDDFGRFQGTLSAQASSNQGRGVLAGSSRSSETLNMSYALTRIWTLTGSIGHEKIDYAGLNPVHIDGPTWSAGVTVTPDPNTSVAVSYGQKSGRPSLTVDASTVLSPRIVISANYGEVLSTSAEDLQNSLASSSVGAGGVAINRTTGAPIISSSNFNGTQGALTYNKTINGTLTWLHDRDTVSFSVNRVQSSVISAAAVGGPIASTGVNGTVSWQHEFSEDLHGNIFTMYGQRSALSALRTAANQTTMTVFAGLTYAISQTLQTHVQATYTAMTAPLATQKPTTTMVVVGLSKMF